MKEAGCIQLDFGVETGSPKLLEISNKKISISEIVKAFSLCKKYGIRTLANMLLNLPEETEDDLTMSHKLLAQIKPTYISVGAVQPYPGTAFYDKYLKAPIPKEQYSKLDRLNPPEEYRMSQHNINFNTLLHRWWIKYGIYTPLETNFFKADRRYWMTVFKSKRKLAYLDFLLKELVITPISYANVWLKILQTGEI